MSTIFLVEKLDFNNALLSAHKLLKVVSSNKENKLRYMLLLCDTLKTNSKALLCICLIAA